MKRNPAKRDVPASKSGVIHVGLDEAGRGSLIGPLVVGAYAVSDYDGAASRRLRELGVKDSKQLSPAQRIGLYRQLRGPGVMLTAAAPPATIDRYVARGGLNALEIKLMATVARRLGGSVLHVDACDPDAARFGRTLALELAEGGRRVVVHARHKADRDVPLVGAASIVAKVTRDRAIGDISRAEGLELGSGYPSDQVTRDSVKGLLRKGTLPPWVRSSWSTIDTLKRELYLRSLEAYER